MSGMMLGAAAWQLSGIPWTFDFNSKLTALPTVLRRMNATYTRNSVKNVVQDGALVTLANNQFGTSYDAVTGLYGYVPEPAATNLLTYSEQLDNAAWAKTNVTISANATTAPDGTTTADLITRGSTAAAYTNQNVAKAASAITYTQSQYVQKSVGNYVALRLQGTYPNSADVVFNINTGAIHSAAAVAGTFTGATASIVAVGGWYRVTLSATTDTAIVVAPHISFNSNGVVVDGTDSAANSAGYVWGAQLETGSRATSYIATTGSTATRAYDVLRVPLANIPGFSSAAYTLFGEYRDDYIGGAGTQHTLVQVDANTTANYANLYTLDNAGTPVALVRSGAVNQSVQVGANSTTVRWSFAVSCQLNSIKAAFKGVAAAEDTSAAMPVTPITLHIGCNEFGAAQFNGYIIRAGLIPQALTQAQINAMTML